MNKSLILITVLLSQPAYSQIVDDIERLLPLSSTQFDSIFNLTGKTLPVFPQRDSSKLDSTWLIKGKVMDYINGEIRCGSIFCTADVLKVKNKENEIFYIVHLYDYDDSVIGKEVSMNVRFLEEKDIAKFNFISNSFRSENPYLIDVSWRTE
jgi:hypothetical protein